MKAMLDEDVPNKYVVNMFFYFVFVLVVIYT